MFHSLRQASGEWYIPVVTFLKKFGCECNDADPTIYLLCNGKDFRFIPVDVDEIYMFANGQTIIELVTKRFKTKFEIKVSEKVSQFVWESRSMMKFIWLSCTTHH